MNSTRIPHSLYKTKVTIHFFQDNYGVIMHKVIIMYVCHVCKSSTRIPHSLYKTKVWFRGFAKL